MSNTISSYLSPYIVGNAIEALSENMSLLKCTNHDFSTAAGSKGQTVSLGVPQPLVAESVTAANTAPAPSDITLGKRSITLSNEYKTSFALTGKETQDYELSSVVAEQIKEAVRGMSYKVNATLWEKYYQIPYATGNSGTGIFASNANPLSDMDRQLTERLCPLDNRKFICGTKDYAALINLTEVHYAQQSGMAAQITGQVGDVRGFMVQRDQQIPTHTIGTLTGNPDTTAEVLAGVASVGITCDSNDAVALKQGDLIEFGDGYSYSVQADVSIGNSATGTIVLDRGLEATVVVDSALALATTNCTFDASSILSIGGRMDGYSVVGRLPETAPMGYATQGEHMPIVDPVSGFPFLISVYPQYKQVALEVSAIWGVEVTDSRKLMRGLSTST